MDPFCNCRTKVDYFEVLKDAANYYGYPVSWLPSPRKMTIEVIKKMYSLLCHQKGDKKVVLETAVW